MSSSLQSPQRSTPLQATTGRARSAYTFVVAAAIGVGIVYLLLGVKVIPMAGGSSIEGVIVPLIVAGLLYIAVASLAILVPGRAVWIGGAFLQALVLVGYVAVAPERTPSYEAWGLGLKAAQVALLCGFVYLMATRVDRRRLTS